MTHRRKVVAGNWKMNGSKQSSTLLAQNIMEGAINIKHTQIIVCPTFVHLSQIKELLGNSLIKLGAQDVSIHDKGAYTGQISSEMLIESGCSYVIVGHSESRLYGKQSDSDVANKAQTALNANLTPIICVGESLDERDNNQTESVIKRQLSTVIDVIGINAFKTAIVAYEPIWAIGTGKAATPEQAQQIHAFIRSLLANEDEQIAQEHVILYGGSVKPDNASVLFSQPDIDGGLIGGAALDAQNFLAIATASENL